MKQPCGSPEVGSRGAGVPAYGHVGVSQSAQPRVCRVFVSARARRNFLPFLRYIFILVFSLF